MKVHYLKLYNMAHLLALNVLLLPKDLTIIFICCIFLKFLNFEKKMSPKACVVHSQLGVKMENVITLPFIDQFAKCKNFSSYLIK